MVYLISCKVCPIQWVGSTTTKFRFRSRLRAHTRLSDGDKSKDDLIYRHYYALGHHGLEEVSIKLIDKVSHECTG